MPAGSSDGALLWWLGRECDTCVALVQDIEQAMICDMQILCDEFAFVSIHVVRLPDLKYAG